MTVQFFAIALVTFSLIACLPQSETSKSQIDGPSDRNQAPYFDKNLNALLQVNEHFELQLNPVDTDNDPLTYEFTNLPPWITYNQNTTLLAGTPTESDINIYPNISVSVSDGIDTIIAGPFTIEVVNSLHSASITWTPVTQNQDNETINNIEGYKILWGSNSGEYSSNLIVDGQETNEALIHRLKTGEYFFAMKALLPSGFEGPLSSEFVLTIRDET